MAKSGDLVSYDPSGAFLEHTGISPDEFAALAPRLEGARREVLVERPGLRKSSCVAPAEQPVETDFVELPERTLDDYVDRRDQSELGRILNTAHRLRETVDRVVVLGSVACTLAGCAVLNACCEPYFNELSRGQRGCRPRIYFARDHFDNDAAVGLRKLLTEGRSPDRLEDRWVVIAIGSEDGEFETAVAFRQFLAALRSFYGEGARRWSELVVSVAGVSERQFATARESGWEARFCLPAGLHAPYCVFSAAGLLPAAVVGLDVVRLLEGASAMNDHFRSAPPGRNAVLDFVGVGHLMETKRRANIRILQVWAAALESVGRWYELLLAETQGKCGHVATRSNMAVNGDGLGRGRQDRKGRRDSLVTNLIVDRWRCDPWIVSRSDSGEDSLRGFAGQTLPDLMGRAIRAEAESSRREGRPAGDIHLPRLNEYTVGQLLQMLMIANAVESHLKG